MTFRETAVAWGRENGIPVPEYGTPEWKPFYQRWWVYAFAEFNKVKTWYRMGKDTHTIEPMKRADVRKRLKDAYTDVDLAMSEAEGDARVFLQTDFALYSPNHDNLTLKPSRRIDSNGRECGRNCGCTIGECEFPC